MSNHLTHQMPFDISGSNIRRQDPGLMERSPHNDSSADGPVLFVTVRMCDQGVFALNVEDFATLGDLCPHDAGPGAQVARNIERTSLTLVSLISPTRKQAWQDWGIIIGPTKIMRGGLELADSSKYRRLFSVYFGSHLRS